MSFRRYAGYFGLIRYDEVLLVGSVPVLAVLFSTANRASFSAGRFIVFCAAVFFLLAHIYVFNDWAELRIGVKGERGADRLILKKNLLFSIFLGIAAAVLSFNISTLCLAINLSVMFLSFLYSSPLLRVKAIPVLSSVVHFLGASALFFSGYYLFHPIDANGLFIGLYFSLIICAGQLIHEAGDCRCDLEAGLRTNAVCFGVGKVFNAGFLLFSLSAGYMVFLALAGVVPFVLAYGVIVVYIAHACFFIGASRHSIGVDALRSFRKKYRVLYVIYGIFISFVLLWKIKA